MKKIIFLFVLIIIAASCSLFPVKNSIDGIYYYTGVFYFKKLYLDTYDTSGKADSVYEGTAALNWQTLKTVIGDKIKIEKSVGDSQNYIFLDSIPVNQSGAYIDSIETYGLHFYRVSVENSGKSTLMNEYIFNVLKIEVKHPSIEDTVISPDSFDIIFSSVKNSTKYSVKLFNSKGDSIWGEDEIVDTFCSFTAGIYLAPGIYTVSVSSSIADSIQDKSLMITHGSTQFLIK